MTKRKELTAAEIRKLRVILRRAITPWIAESLCRLAIRGVNLWRPHCVAVKRTKEKK